MTTKPSPECERLLYPLVRYFRDCLAAQCQWARSVNVIEQKDVMLVPLTADEQHRLGTDGRLELRGSDAVEVAKRMAAGGAGGGVVAGGAISGGVHPTARPTCGPKVIALRCWKSPCCCRSNLPTDRLSSNPRRLSSRSTTAWSSELLGGNTDDLDDRLADLAELVPDFPIDATEFDTFWNGFRMIAPEVPLSPELPPRRESRRPDRSSNTRQGTQAKPDAPVSSTASSRLELVDFFVPEFPATEIFHLLPGDGADSRHANRSADVGLERIGSHGRHAAAQDGVRLRVRSGLGSATASVADGQGDSGRCSPTALDAHPGSHRPQRTAPRR